MRLIYLLFVIASVLSQFSVGTRVVYLDLSKEAQEASILKSPTQFTSCNNDKIADSKGVCRRAIQH